jgi:gamma-tubulin complex component 3
MSSRQPARPRRIEDALSQLVDSLTPPISLSEIGDTVSEDADELLAEAEERRHRENLERAWRIIDTYSPGNDAGSPADGAGLGISRRGSLAGGENVNNASDLIKRKLLRENASPDKAVRFSNLYSRLLTQPVLSQKWAILYLLYRLSSSDSQVETADENGRSRSPLMDAGNLQNMMMKGGHQRVRHGLGPRLAGDSDDDSPAVSSSASQMPAKMERKASARRQEWERAKDVDQEHGHATADRVKGGRMPRGSFDAAPRDNRPLDDQKASFQTQSFQTQSFSDNFEKRPHESGLLRDLPYNLQGLSSSNLQFSSSSVLKLPPTLPIPVLSLLNTLAEPCLLYKGLSKYVEDSGGGLLTQSLRAALSNELRSYLGLVATLEGEIRRALAANGDPYQSKESSKGLVTLKRCVVWTRDATMALRLMSLIVEEAHSKCAFSSTAFFESSIELTACQTKKVVN